MSQGDSDQCIGCSQPSTTPYIPNPTVYAEGDICAILETTRTPVYLLLTNKRPPSQSSANISRTRSKSRKWLPRLPKSRSSLPPANSESDSFQWNSKASPRPGIVLSEVEISSAQGSDAVMVCLLTTFNETADRDKLPLVLRHFSFPYPRTASHASETRTRTPHRSGKRRMPGSLRYHSRPLSNESLGDGWTIGKRPDRMAHSR